MSDLERLFNQEREEDIWEQIALVGNAMVLLAGLVGILRRLKR